MFYFLALVVTVSSLAFWYCYYSCECAINGGFFTRSIKWWQVVPHFLLEEILWLSPWGGTRRKAYIVKLISGWDDGYIGRYTYKEIRQKDLYSQAASEVLPGWGHFLFTHVLLPFGPLFVFVSLWRHWMG